MSNTKAHNKKMTRVTVSVDPEEYRAIERLADSDERSTSWMIRKAIREFLQHHSPAPVSKEPK